MKKISNDELAILFSGPISVFSKDILFLHYVLTKILNRTVYYYNNIRNSWIRLDDKFNICDDVYDIGLARIYQNNNNHKNSYVIENPDVRIYDIDIAICKLKNISLIFYNLNNELPAINLDLQIDDDIHKQYISEFSFKRDKILAEICSKTIPELLTVVEPQYGFECVSMFDDLKEWINKYKRIIQTKPVNIWPRGILIHGNPGTGKSFVARAIAKELGFRLFKLDAVALYDKYVGSSEQKVRLLINYLDSLNNAVLFIDEIDKILTYGSETTDAGVSKRVIADLLMWLADREPKILVIGVTNKLYDLNSDLIRRGRFDKLFKAVTSVDVYDFIDKFINKYKLDKKIYHDSLLNIVNKNKQYTGAELEGILLDYIVDL